MDSMLCSNVDINGNCECDHCKNELNLDKLCVRKINACRIKVKELDIKGTLCAEALSSPSLCAGVISAQNAGISNLTANDLCVPGTLKVANLLNCGKYRANVVYSTMTTYTLGNFIDFNMILDDPNGNVTLSPVTYTVPVSGWYEANLQFNQSNLVPSPGFGPILGVPVANPQLYVNGVLYREIFSSFLSFYKQQKTSLNTILPLKVGDIVQMKYNILALDQSSGVINVPGVVDSIGNGTDANTSGFKIHMLSVDCADLPCSPSIACIPCMPK